jgi:hypothetical protein
MKKKKDIILLDSHKIFIAMQFLFQEDKECLTEYGEGLLKGLVDPTSEVKIPVIDIEKYNRLQNKMNKLIEEKNVLLERIDKANKRIQELKGL